MKKASKKKIVITGGSGLLGSYFFNKYKSKYKIIKYNNRIEKINLFYNWIKKKNFDYFIHFAAITRQNNQVNRNKINLINVKSSKNILLTLHKLKIKDFKYFLFISSSHVYGKSKFKIKETTKRKPINIYGMSKKKVEDFILKNQSKFNFKIGIARVFNITGKKQKKGYFITDMINKIKTGDKINNINKFRDFIHLDDVVKSLNLLIKKNYSKPINICSGKKINLIEVCQILNRKLFKKKLIFNEKKGENIFGNNTMLKKLGIKKFKNFNQIIKSIL